MVSKLSCGSLKNALCMENQKVFTNTCLFDFLVALEVDVNPLTIQGRKLRPRETCESLRMYLGVFNGRGWESRAT